MSFKVKLLLLLLFSANVAQARIGSIPNAQVNKEELRVISRTAYDLDDNNPALDNRLRTRIGLDYGFTDNYAWSLILQWQDLAGQAPQLSNIILDQRFEFTNSQDDGYYSGIRLRYEARTITGNFDIAHIRLIAGKEIGNWDIRFNQIVGMEVGAHRKAGMLLDTRTHVTYMYMPKHRFGFESFSNFGNLSQNLGYAKQSHTVGPTFIGALTDEINYEAGYMAGVSANAPDHSFYFGFSKLF